VGDWVAAALVAGEEKAVIEALLPRRTAFTRSDPWSDAEEVVAANVDTVLVVTAVGRDFSPRRLERYLAAAHESGADPVVLVNKADLADSPPVDEARAAAPGVPVHVVSAKTGAGLEQLEPYLGPGRTVALLGSSGVGKSTLANRLAGTDLATGEVREDERGRHTTTRRQLVLLPAGGLLLDTPGLRELQLSGADLDETFPEIAELASQCRFRNCSHSHEPGCAVLAAVEAGDLPPERHASYVKLAAELAELEERRRRAAW
jgi:ribosome biogenesis GTPase